MGSSGINAVQWEGRLSPGDGVSRLWEKGLVIRSRRTDERVGRLSMLVTHHKFRRRHGVKFKGLRISGPCRKTAVFRRGDDCIHLSLIHDGLNRIDSLLSKSRWPISLRLHAQIQ